MKLSQTGLDLIKKFEGCELKAYKCPAGIWTIGYGHTGKVTQGQTITQKQADELLEKDVQRFVDGVKRVVKVDINQNQFDALVSFAYNCGVDALKTSTLLKYLNAKQFDKAALEFDRWNKGGGKVLPGLVNRRAAERALFATPIPVVNPKRYQIKTGTFQDKSKAEEIAKQIRDTHKIIVHVVEA